MAGLAQGQPIEVRGFRVTGPGLAGPPSLANPQFFGSLSPSTLTSLAYNKVFSTSYNCGGDTARKLIVIQFLRLLDLRCLLLLSSLLVYHLLFILFTFRPDASSLMPLLSA